MSDQAPIFERKNVLITGGSGFIGSHLCEALLTEANVICIDDFSNSSIHNIEHLLQYPNFEFIRYDINEPIDLEMLPELDKFRVKFQGIQEIYHLACPTSPKNFESLKIHSLLANSAAVINTLNLAVKYRAKYIFGSSAVVYGKTQGEQESLTEGFEGIVDHLSPRGCYDEGKRFGETCVETYRQVYDVDAKIARIFTTYGPRMKLNDGLLIPDFITNALEGKDIVIYGDHGFQQSLCYISDMIDGLKRLMKSPKSVSVVNLGDDRAFDMVKVAEKIIEFTESTSEIRYEESLLFLTHPGIPNLSKAKQGLGWLPLVQLKEGLKKTIDYTIANKEIYHF